MPLLVSSSSAMPSTSSGFHAMQDHGNFLGR